MPEDKASGNQFGFSKGRGAMFTTSFLNDISAYKMKHGPPLYVCSFNAENVLIASSTEGCIMN